jgi:hypothetical protein
MKPQEGREPEEDTDRVGQGCSFRSVLDVKQFFDQVFYTIHETGKLEI